MTPEQLKTIEDALDWDASYWTHAASDPEEECKAELAKIADARAALRQLVDSVRWRKQSEEPAPDGLEVVTRKPGFEPIITVGDDMRVEQHYFDSE